MQADAFEAISKVHELVLGPHFGNAKNIGMNLFDNSNENVLFGFGLRPKQDLLRFPSILLEIVLDVIVGKNDPLLPEGEDSRQQNDRKQEVSTRSRSSSHKKARLVGDRTGLSDILGKKPRKVALGVGTAVEPEPGMPADWAEQAEYFGAFAVFASLLDLLRPGEALYRTPLVLCETHSCSDPDSAPTRGAFSHRTKRGRSQGSAPILSGPV